MSELENKTILYLDNFRGFEDTFIPLKKVNFLMGENSTGKTSILSLINLIHDSSFWLYRTPKFSNGYVNLGSFPEIADSKNGKNSFCIGILNNKITVDEANANKKKNISNYILLTFYNNKGIPSLSDYSFTQENLTTIAKFSRNGNTVSFKILTYNSEELAEVPDLTSKFKQWLDFVSLEKKKSSFKKIRSKELPFSVPFIQSIIESNLMKEESKKKNAATVKSTNFFEFFNNFDLGRGVCWIAPIRAKPRRIYANFENQISPDGEHAPFILRDLLISSKKSSKKYQEFIDNFGNISGLFDTININSFGKSNMAPFEVNIALSSHLFQIQNVGYGISQVLPILVDLAGRNEYTLFEIQQPEIHLHPKAQAAFGELIYQISSKKNMNFLIETHSEYLVNRFRYNMHKNKEEKNVESQILFFERTDNGNRVHVIGIGNDGKYSKDKPESFNRFFIDEELNLLEI